MNRPLGHRPSYACRSILAARELLQQGLVWQVGDGRSIFIWQDRWLPTPILHSVQSIPHVLASDSRVAALIDRDLNTWNKSLIREVFNEDEAGVIANIPLSPSLPHGRLVWNCTNDGVFSVRSAYHLGMEIRDRFRGGSSTMAQGQDLWKILWNLHVPNTVKHFLWRACNNLLPTMANLLQRKVVTDSKCPCCEREEESVIHALWCCPAAQDV